MNIELHFETGKTISSVIEETKIYFVQAGFKLAKEELDYLEFKRGSLFVNRFIFNPLKWKSETKINFAEGGKVHLSAYIDTAHQLVIKKEVDKWNVFVENYEKELNRN